MPAIMSFAITPLTDVSHWARGSGLEVVLLGVGVVLGARALRWIGEAITGRIDDNAAGSDTLVRSEQSKHRHAVARVVTYVAIVGLYSITGVLVLDRVGVPVTSLVAPAAALGVALGFGAQRIVQDILAGFFLVTERQYGYGDVIRLSLGSGIEPVTGTVEDVTLRVTQIRTVNGEVIITPNGHILQVTNLSRDWARAVVDVPVPVTADLNAVIECLAEVGQEAFADPDLHDLLLDEPTVMGVESLSIDQLNLRLVARTLPGKQFEVGQLLRSRIALRLRQQGVHLSPSINTTDATAVRS